MKCGLPIFRSRKRKNSPAPEPRHEQQSGPFHLPLELHFLILDHLDVDRRPFCCVCRAWAAHLQFFIFKDVFVTPQIFSRLAALFDTHPHLGSYIITLRVAHGNVDFLKKIVTFLPAMPNLRQLDTISWTFGGLDPSQLEFVAPLAAITHLRMCTTTFSMAQTALRFVSLFPHLNSLDIIGRWIRWPDVTVDNMLLLGWFHDTATLDDLFSKIGGGLKDLRIETRMDHRPLGPVVPIRHCTALRRLRIAPPGFASPVSIIVLLLSKVTSSSLTHLYVDTFVGPKHLELSWHEVDQALATLGSLQEVVFDLYGMFDASGGAEYLELVAGMRAQMVQADARGFLHFKCGGRSV
ncbi:hypothetical protein C8J57DRAFT_1304714 [Mycena rebaudengoi]|nr:hypothetical protein C8J57DRAFT_1304714 [Mycena rebaudengoi]